MKKPLENLFLILLLLPLLWIYAPNSHDWGGDFAAYIAQAENILAGRDISATGYLYNPDYYRLAPPSYPSGFSLILTPWIAIFGSGIGGLVLYMSILLLLFALGFYRVLRLQYTPIVAVVAVLITFYNPWMIRFKSEVIADMPFAMLVVWSVLAYRKASLAKSKLFIKWTWCALLVSLAILTKTIGWILPIAFALDSVFFSFKKKVVDPLVGIGYMVGITALCTWLVSNIWLATPADHFAHFAQIAAEQGGYWSSAWHNTLLYLDIYKAFFIKDLGNFQFIGNATASLLLCFALIGAVLSWFKRGVQVQDWVFLGLMGALVLFPITNGFRYLLPAFVFFLGYSIYGLCILPWHYMVRKALPVFCLLFMTGQYVNGWVKISHLPDPMIGPYHEDYASLHSHIEAIHAKHPNAVFAAAKPRVFSFLHGVEAFSIRPDLSPTEAKANLEKMAGTRPLYIIQIGYTEHPALDQIEAPYQIRNEQGLFWVLKGPID